jgi:hypothetical protein
MATCDAVMVKVSLPPVAPDAAVLAAAAGEAGMLAGVTRLHVAEDATLLHLDIEFEQPQPVAPARLRALEQAVARCCSLPADAVAASRLVLAFERGAIDARTGAPFHYVVETNVAEGWFDETVRWYDTEHMPALAAVPGCQRARRYLNLDGGPRSVAAYELASLAVLTSAPWLAVRATDWASRVRPHFRDTSRTRFRTAAAGTMAGATVRE